jgi:4-amino-4-deoxy-L-arabinose transferase-like glycosyltransferase
MLGNETTCALFATAALLRLVGEGPGRAAARDGATSDLRHAAITGALAGLAALAKSTGLLVAAVVALVYLLRLRAEPARALRVALVAGGVAALVASPHYLRLAIRSGGEPLAVITGAALSPELAAEMASQPPGERHLGDYLLLPPAMLFAPVHAAPGMERSVPGLLYASLFADGHAQYLPASVRPVLLAEVILALLGLLPTALGGFGFWLVLRDPARRRALGAPLLFLVLLLASWLRYTWMLPTFAAVKASYLLPALLAPVAALAVGLSWFEGRARAALRGALLGIAALSAAVTTWGWWE